MVHESQTEGSDGRMPSRRGWEADSRRESGNSDWRQLGEIHRTASARNGRRGRTGGAFIQRVADRTDGLIDRIAKTCQRDFGNFRETARRVRKVVIPRASTSEMFGRDAIGVRTHADGVGVQRANVLSKSVRSIARPSDCSMTHMPTKTGHGVDRGLSSFADAIRVN